MEKRQKAVKEKFQYKKEIAKRQKDFLQNIKNLVDLFNKKRLKKKEINELFKQEKISYKNDIKNAVSDYNNEIQKQKNEIQKQKDSIKQEQIKFKEITKLELEKLNREIVVKKHNHYKSLLNIKTETKKVILKNKILIQKINQKNNMELIQQKKKYDEKKVEFAKNKIIHLEKLINQKKELENIKRQQAYDKVDLYKKIKEMKSKRMLARKNQKYELKMLIEKERQAFELDAAKIKLEQISYNNLLKLKNQEDQFKNEKLKFETDKLIQSQKIKEIIKKQLITEEKQSLKNNKIENQFFDIQNDQKISSIIDKKSLPLKIDLDNETIKGFIISDVGKRAIKIFNKLNVADTSNKLKNAKISKDEINLILKIRNLKKENALIPISDYVKLVSFIDGKNITKEKIHALIVSIIYNIYKGRTFSFLGGYFSLVKVKGYRRIVYSTTKSKLSRFSVISLPDSNVTKMLEELLVKKLKYKPFIKITENIVLTNINNQIKVITDIGFMR